MPNLCTCPNCGACHEAASEEASNEPTWASRTARWCRTCLRRDKAEAAAIGSVAP
jgi:hypothetical protein